MQCMWYSSKPTLIVQATCAYDYTFGFCKWCGLQKGPSVDALSKVINRVLKAYDASRAFVIGGEVLLRSDIGLILKVLNDYGLDTEVFTKASISRFYNRLLAGNPELIHVVVPSLDPVRYMSVSGGYSITPVIDGVNLLAREYSSIDILTLSPDEKWFERTRWQLNIPIKLRTLHPLLNCSKCKTIMIDCCGRITICPLLESIDRYKVLSLCPECMNNIILSLINRKNKLTITRVVSVKLKLGDIEVGEDVINILREVERTGSLIRTADNLGLPLSTVKKKIERVEKALGLKLINTFKGGIRRGGAKLTSLATEILREYYKTDKLN